MSNQWRRGVACFVAVLATCAGCKSDKAGSGSGATAASSAADTPSGSPANSKAATSGISLEVSDESLESAGGDLGDKLHGDGPAVAFLSSSPLAEGPRKWVTLYVFPKGTDPAGTCESNFPGPKSNKEYVLGLDLQYDGELKVGPAVSGGSPSVSYMSKSGNDNVTSAAVGKPNFIEMEITAVSAESISVVAKAKPGAPFKLQASFTAKICKDD